MGVLQLLLARWRVDLALLVLLAVVLGATAGMVGAVPRLLDRLERASLAQELAASTPDRRGLSAEVVREVPLAGADDIWSRLAASGVELEDEEVAPPLGALLAPPSPVLDSLRWRVEGPPGEEPADAFERRLTVRSQLDLPELQLVVGRLPDGEVGTVTWEEAAGDGAGGTTTAPLHEVLLTASTAAAMGMEVGDRRVVVVDDQGPTVRRLLVQPEATAVVELAGIVELPPPDEPVWFGDPRLHRPTQFDTSSNTTFFGFGIVPPEAVGELPGAADGLPSQVGWRWRLDETALLDADAGPAAAAALALRSSVSIDPREPVWSTGLDRIVRQEAARRTTAVEVLGLVLVAVVGVGVALLGVVGVVLAGRRRDALALVRGRGVSAWQVLGAGAAEASAVALAGVGTAAVVLLVVLPGGGGEGLLAAVTLLGFVVLVGAVWPDAVRPLGALLAERRRGGGRQRVGRPVLEALVVLVAVLSAVAVLQRGAVVDGDVDPLVVVAPAALAFAGAVVAARVVPLLLRVLGPLAVRGRRGLAAPLGVARATRQGRGGPVVLLVTLGVGVAATALAAHAAVVRGQAAAATERVGADVRVAAPPLGTLSPDFDPPGAEVVEVATVEGRLLGPGVSRSVDVVLVDALEFAAVTADQALPTLLWDGVAPAPVLLSSPLRETSEEEPGDLSLRIGDAAVGVVAAATVPRVLGLDAAVDGRFVVVEREAVVSATGTRPLPSVRLVRTDDPEAVAAVARASDPDATVLVRAEVRAALADAPLARGVRLGFLVAAVAVAVAMLLAVVLALAAAAPVRRREAAVLAAVGATRRRIAWVALAEVLPTVAAAAAVGVALAVGVARLLRDSLDLAVFTGTVDPTPLPTPPVGPTAALLVLVLAVAGAAAVATIGRVDTAMLLREGE